MRNFARRALLTVIVGSSLLFAGVAGGWARERPLTLAIATLFILLTYAWGKELIGRWWAFLPAFLMAFSPGLLADSSGDGIGIARALALNTSLLAYLGALANPSVSRTILSGIALGASVMLTPDAIVLLPVFIAAALAHYLATKSQRFGQLLAIAALAVLIAVAGTLFLNSMSGEISALGSLATLEQLANGASLRNIGQIISREPLPALILIAAALIAALGRAIKSLWEILFKRSRILRGYLEMHIPEFAMLVLIGFWIRRIVLDDAYDPASALTLLPSVYILTSAAVRRWFSLDEIRKARNLILKIFIMHEELIHLSIKSLLLMFLIVWYLVNTIVAAPDFGDYRNILVRLMSF